EGSPCCRSSTTSAPTTGSGGCGSASRASASASSATSTACAGPATSTPRIPRTGPERRSGEVAEHLLGGSAAGDQGALDRAGVAVVAGDVHGTVRRADPDRAAERMWRGHRRQRLGDRRDRDALPAGGVPVVEGREVAEQLVVVDVGVA